MKNGRMQAKDIPDDAFLDAVRATPPIWRDRWSVQKTLETTLGYALPENLFLAKARALGAKQKLEGCTRCTCRGDYHFPEECRAAGCCYAPDFDWSQHPAWSEMTKSLTGAAGFNVSDMPGLWSDDARLRAAIARSDMP